MRQTSHVLGTANLDFDLVAAFVHDLIVARHAEQGWVGFRAVDVLQAHRVCPGPPAGPLASEAPTDERVGNR